MRAIGLTEFGGLEVLHVVSLPSPEPGAGEVRVRVHAGGWPKATGSSRWSSPWVHTGERLAERRGLTVIADAPPGEENLVRGLGANHVIARGPRFADQVRSLVPGGVPGLVDGANLDAAALAAIADGGAIATVKGC